MYSEFRAINYAFDQPCNLVGKLELNLKLLFNVYVCYDRSKLVL